MPEIAGPTIKELKANTRFAWLMPEIAGPTIGL